jgi:hypothetical protein
MMILFGSSSHRDEHEHLRTSRSLLSLDLRAPTARIGRVRSPIARTLRSLALILPVLTLFAGSPELASADLGLVFKQARAAPGDRVLLYSGRRSDGRVSGYPPIKDVEVYFVPLSLAKLQNHLRSRGRPRDARWLPLGPPRQNENGVVRIWMTVPQVPIGDYTVGFWCKWCGPPKGDFFTSAFPGQRWAGRRHYTILRVTEPRSQVREAAPAAEPPGSGSENRAWLFALGSVGVLALAAGISSLRRRTS